MTIGEIINTVCEQMLQGVMVHETLCDYYSFLGLKGYGMCHKYHFIKEVLEYRDLCEHYISRYEKLLPDATVTTPTLIPSNWYNHSMGDVDNNTKRNAVKQGLNEWKDWEVNTKTIYESMYKEANDIGEIVMADKIMCMINNVEDEIGVAKNSIRDKEAVDYDMIMVISEQRALYHKYKHKLNKEF